MNPLKLYIKNRLENLEEENKWLHQCLRNTDHKNKIGYCFQRIIKEADIQIAYIDSAKMYQIYSGKTGQIIYAFNAKEEWDTTFISYLLEVLPVRRD